MPGAEGASAPRIGVIDRMIASYRRPRAAMTAMLAERPGELVLFSFMLIAGVIAMVGAAAEIAALSPTPDQSASDVVEQRRRILMERLIGAFLLTPLGVYLFSVIATPILRAFGGEGGFYETRAAFAWSLLVTAPLALLVSFLDAAALRVADPAGDGLWAAALFSTLAWGALALALYFWASFIAAAQGFRSAAGVLGGLLAVATAVWVLSLALG